MKTSLLGRQSGGRGILAAWTAMVFACAFFPSTVSPAQDGGTFDTLYRAFVDPPVEHTQMPFWFWNGDLEESEIKRQIAEMHGKGIHGFVIHARIGLSREIGYMTPKWLSLVRVALEEAERRGMMVYLYDEGMYPSGSAHGRVTEGRPDLASQGLRVISRRIRGPQTLQLGIPIEKNEKLVAVVQMQWAEAQQKYLAHTARVVTGADARIPSGEWGIFMFVQTPSRGVIRGVHWDEEDNAPNAPASADLLNPEATERFIRYTHERYLEAVGQFFGGTVEGIFTDEPSILGRRAKRGLRPWTDGLDRYAAELLGYDFRLALPFLFGAEALDGRELAVERDFAEVIQARLGESYYRPLSDWCARHDIALTGHPAEAGDQHAQTYFHHPGQDVVWRWVLPGKTATEGEQSTSAKAAASVAAQRSRRFVINEAYGAYGWRLTMDEMKWLADWLFVRGTNRLVPHAFYYSDEPPRLMERPPDLSWYNLWWDEYDQFAAYTDRLSWLRTDAVPVVDIAILSAASEPPWRAAKVLLEQQVDYHYLAVDALDEVKDGAIGRANYRLLLADGDLHLTAGQVRELDRLLSEGMQLVVFDGVIGAHPLRRGFELATRRLDRIAGLPGVHEVESIREMTEKIRSIVPVDVRADPPSPDLRYAHVIKDGHSLYLFTNEGQADLRTRLFFAQPAFPEAWNPENGSRTEVGEPRSHEEGISFQLVLPVRQSIVIAFDALRPVEPNSGGEKMVQRIVRELPSNGWTISAERFGENRESSLGSWTRLPGMDTWSGMVLYERSVHVPAGEASKATRITLDCGAAEVFVSAVVNGQHAGTRLWRPFRFDVTSLVRPEANDIEIGVTNTRANELTGAGLPSGLFGPVKLIFDTRPEH